MSVDGARSNVGNIATSTDSDFSERTSEAVSEQVNTI